MGVAQKNRYWDKLYTWILNPRRTDDCGKILVTRSAASLGGTQLKRRKMFCDEKGSSYHQTRREMLKMSALGGIGLALGLGGCAPYARNVDWESVSDRDFSIDKFDKWFRAYKLYNRVNPNLKQKHTTQHSSFISQLRNWYTPGIGYRSNEMYAVAPGTVIGWGEIGAIQGRMGGGWFRIMHPPERSSFNPLFDSTYAHLGSIMAKGQVKRNQLVAKVPYQFSNNPKLIFRKSGNHIDPDNYGENHGYMNYWDGNTDLHIDNVRERDTNQKNILYSISKYLPPETQVGYTALRRREHRRVFENKYCFWDEVEIMRYYEELYNARPQLFPELSKDHFEELNRSFYANQPIILTLPLKK